MSERDTERIEVCATEDLPPGEKTLATVDETVVCVRNVDGEYYAIENECAHQGGPICKGKVAPELVGAFEAPGERVREEHGERLAVACPWHGWEYDLETGVHLGVEDIALETFHVAVDEGTVVIRPER